jgi:hypothetical protein
MSSIMVKLIFNIEFTTSNILVIVGAIFILFLHNYISLVHKIEISDGKLKIKNAFREYVDLISNFSAIELTKYTRVRNKYYVIVLVNKKSKKKFKIDSDEWYEYDQIKRLLIELSILTEKTL